MVTGSRPALIQWAGWNRIRLVDAPQPRASGDKHLLDRSSPGEGAAFGASRLSWIAFSLPGTLGQKEGTSRVCFDGLENQHQFSRIFITQRAIKAAQEAA